MVQWLSPACSALAAQVHGHGSIKTGAITHGQVEGFRVTRCHSCVASCGTGQGRVESVGRVGKFAELGLMRPVLVPAAAFTSNVALGLSFLLSE